MASSLSPPPCELCHLPSNLFCPPDDAFLCWLCDTLVHSANFLVARHRRAFLCRSCASPTPGLESGPSLPAETHFCRLCYLNSDDECSSMTQSGPGLISDDSCSDNQISQASARSGRCRSQRKKRSRRLTSSRGGGPPGFAVRDLTWQAEASCDGSDISSESISEVGNEASSAMNEEGISLKAIRCSFQQSSPHVHRREGCE